MDPHTLAMARAQKEYPNLPESYFKNENLLEEQRNLEKFEQKQTETVNQPIISALLDTFKEFKNIEITHGSSGTTTLKISKSVILLFCIKTTVVIQLQNLYQNLLTPLKMFMVFIRYLNQLHYLNLE